MLYSIIDAKLGEEKEFLPLIAAEARKLGGSIMTHSELLNKIRKLKS